jgi:DNA-binding LacI/PurR family transcriptional regulator
VGRRPVRIAVLAAYFNDQYEWEVLRGAREAIEAVGGQAICFAGAGLEDPDPAGRARQFVFDLVRASNVDAVLSVSTVLGHFSGAEELGTWLRHYDLPVASVGAAHGIPSIQIDDALAVARLVKHLIVDHGHRRIAFLSGPASNTEAKNRLSGYARALDEHGLDYDSKLVLHGQFTRESGVRAVSELFDRRQLRAAAVNAIVCVNDCTAFGVIDELSRRRIGVPEQVAVVGFDDIGPSKNHDPSLTTVRQPLRELGREGVRKLLAMLDGSTNERTTSLETELVLRRSCGCVPLETPPAAPGRPDPLHERVHRFVRALGAKMFGPTAELSTVLAEFLPELGVAECAVSEFANKHDKALLRLAFGFDAENLRPQPTVFPASELLPAGFSHLRSSSLLVLPVCYGDRAFGVAALPASTPSGQLCEILAEAFGTALKAIELRRRADAK